MLHEEIAVIEVQVNALAGHYIHTDDTNEYPYIHAVGTLADAVQEKDPVAVQAAQRVEDPINEYPG